MNKKYCYKWNFCVPSTSHILKPISNVIVFGGWELWEVIRSWGWDSHKLDQWPCERESRGTAYPLCSVRSPWRHSHLWTRNQEVSPPQNPNLPGPRSWNSLPPELWKISVLFRSHPVMVFYSSSKGLRQANLIQFYASIWDRLGATYP